MPNPRRRRWQDSRRRRSELVGQQHIGLQRARGLRAVEVLVNRQTDFQSQIGLGNVEIFAREIHAAEDRNPLATVEQRVGPLGITNDAGVEAMDAALDHAVEAQGGLQAGEPAVAAPAGEVAHIAIAPALGVVVERIAAAIGEAPRPSVQHARVRDAGHGVERSRSRLHAIEGAGEAVHILRNQQGLVERRAAGRQGEAHVDVDLVHTVVIDAPDAGEQRIAEAFGMAGARPEQRAGARAGVEGVHVDVSFPERRRHDQGDVLGHAIGRAGALAEEFEIVRNHAQQAVFSRRRRQMARMHVLDDIFRTDEVRADLVAGEPRPRRGVGNRPLALIEQADAENAERRRSLRRERNLGRGGRGVRVRQVAGPRRGKIGRKGKGGCGEQSSLPGGRRQTGFFL